jgi:hypothetical protein
MAESSDTYRGLFDDADPSLIESILHEAMAAQRIAIETTVAGYLRGSKQLSFVSLAASLILLAGTWYLYRDVRETMRQDAVTPVMVPAIVPPPRRVEQTDARFDALDERVERLESGVQRVLELLELPTRKRTGQ